MDNNIFPKTGVIERIFYVSSTVLNQKNKNHWISMFRGIAINQHNVSKEDAENWFTYETIGSYFDDGISPAEACEEVRQDWNFHWKLENEL